MWTFVREMFRDDEREAVAAALEDIASPLDNYGWSSTGIYFFWDPDSRETLYIGLAIDLPNRLGQHLGLVGCPAAGCKRERIDAWFADNERLGYTVALQTPNIQTVGHRQAKALGLDLAAAKLDPMVELDPLPGELEDFEGRLIEHHRLSFGERPPWNAIGGSSSGASQVAGVGPDDLFAIVAAVKDSPMVARRTIRELSADSTATAFEEHLHTARIKAVMFGALGSTVGPAEVMHHLDTLPDPFEVRARIDEANYLEQAAPFNIL